MQSHDWSISLAYCLEASFYPMGLTWCIVQHGLALFRSCVALPGVNGDLRQTLFPTQDLPELINVGMCPRLVEYLADHTCDLEDSIKFFGGV